MLWSFAKLWNESLDNGSDRELVKRDYIWASELGGALIDRWLKMNAVKPTNPPNARSKRKFEAGNIWESIIGYVLSRAGILQNKQQHLTYQYPSLLKTTGRLDFVAGGNPDYEKAKAIIGTEFAFLPEFISRATQNIITKLSEQYPNGLDSIVLEIKSCSSFMFEVYEKNDRPSKNHLLQAFHYIKSLDWPEAHIVYVCKDDARLLEIGVTNPSATEDYYKADIEQLTGYFTSNTEPPKENPIVYDAEFERFSANWKVAYSGYLTQLYGFENQMQFDNTFKPTVERWNRVLGRKKAGKKMTPDNEEALADMRKNGFNIENL